MGKIKGKTEGTGGCYHSICPVYTSPSLSSKRERASKREICPVGNSCLVSEDWEACWSSQSQQSKGWRWKISALPRSKLNVSLSHGSNAPKGERNNLIFFFFFLRSCLKWQPGWSGRRLLKEIGVTMLKPQRRKWELSVNSQRFTWHRRHFKGRSPAM